MKKTTFTGGLGVLFFMYLSKYIAARYGNSGRVIMLSIALLISIVGILWIFLIKKYIAGLLLVCTIIPALIIFIGIYLNKLYLAVLGLVLVPIVLLVITKVVSKYKR